MSVNILPSNATMKKPNLPPELLETRPALEFDEWASHPATSPGIGPPPAHYTVGLKDRIVDLVKRGRRPRQAAIEAGITSNTFDRWMKMGREGHVHLWEFYQEIHQAEAIAEGLALDAVIGTKGDYTQTDPENAKWFLERRHASGYSKDVMLKVNAALEEFFQRLEERLSFDVTDDMVGKNLFEMVNLALAGEEIAAKKPVFILNGSSQIESEEPVGPGTVEEAEGEPDTNDP